MIMAGGGGDYQLKVGLQWLGAGVPGMPGGSAEGGVAGSGGQARIEHRQQIARDKERQEFLKQQTKTGMQHFRSTFGINIGIAAILKQSQIFTGTIGTLFQILGAFIDVILMAFMPIIIPALKLMAKLIPYIRRAAENTVGNIIKFMGMIKSGMSVMGKIIPDRLINWLKSGFMNVLAYFFVVTFVARLLGMQKIWFQFLKAYLISPMLRLLGLILVKLGFQRFSGLGRPGGFGGTPGFSMGRNVAAGAGRTGGQFGGPAMMGRGGSQPGLRFGGSGAGNVIGGAGRMGMMGRIGGRMGSSFSGMGRGGVAGTLAFSALTPAMIAAEQLSQGNKSGATGAMVGGIAGMAIGGAAGSLVGPVGTMVGAGLGSMLGSIIGTVIGESVGANMTAHPSEKDHISTASRAGGGYISHSNQTGTYASRLAAQGRG